MLQRTGSKKKIQFDIVTELAKDKQYTGLEGLEDTRQAVKRSKARGINIYALMMDTEVDDETLVSVYGIGQFVRITHPERLPETVIDAYRAFTLN